MGHDVTVKVGADNSALDTGLAAAKHAVGAFKEHATEQFHELGSELVGAFALSKVIEGIHGLFEEFSQLADLATRLNTTPEVIQKIGYAAKLSGTSLETVTKGLEKVNENAINAIKGDEKLAGAFERLGIEAEDFINLSPDERLLELSKAMEETGSSSSELAHDFRDVLGKSAGELTPLLKEGEEGIKELFDGAKTVSNADVAAMKENMDRLEGYWMNFKAVAATAVNGVVDSVRALWGALNLIGTYLANLPDGFTAAKEAANQFGKEWEESEKKQKKAREEKAVNTNRVDVEGLKADKKAEAEKKAADELQKIKDENAKKEEDARFRNLTLLQKQVDLEQDIAELKNKPVGTDLEEETDKGKILDYQKELENVNKELAKEKEADEKKLHDEIKKYDQERAKDELQAKKEALEAAEQNVKMLEKRREGFTVDSLRQIGGGVAGVNYGLNAAKDDLQRQQLDYARQQVEKLSQAVELLQKTAGDSVVQTSWDGSFS